MDERTLYIGIDLCDDFTQISCFTDKDDEPESVCVSFDKTKYMIPTCLCMRKETGEWLIGEEAVRCLNRNGGYPVDNLLELFESKGEVIIQETVYGAGMLMERFLKNVLGIIRQRFSNNGILYMVITAQKLSEETKAALYTALENAGVERSRVFIQPHTLSFMYYTVSQKKDIWANDVAMFDYGRRGLMYYQLSFSRKDAPVVVATESLDLSEQLSYAMRNEEPVERLVRQFDILAGKALYKKIVSTLYFTGRCFEGNWADDIIRSFCMGRRVFVGQNLYAKGACYAARALYRGDMKEYMFLTENMIENSIYLKLYSNSGEELIELAKAGTDWETAGRECDIILDNTDKLEFMVCDVVKNDSILEAIRLDGIPKRENKTIRLHLTLEFIDRLTAIVRIKDTGFGEFYKTNYRVWEQILQ